MKHVELFGFSGSTYVRTARMVCEEKHVNYQLRPLEFGRESHRALHPFLRMPVMREGDLILYETLAIVSYLDEVCAGPRLTPDSALGRARMLQWISTCNDYLYATLVKGLLKSDDPAEAEIAAARHDLEIVDRQLRHAPFLLGNEIYLCDLFLAPMLAFAETRVGPGLLDALEGIAGWRDRLWSRGSFTGTQA